MRMMSTCLHMLSVMKRLCEAPRKAPGAMVFLRWLPLEGWHSRLSISDYICNIFVRAEKLKKKKIKSIPTKNNSSEFNPKVF